MLRRPTLDGLRRQSYHILAVTTVRTKSASAIELSYGHAGQGTPLVLLHGLGGSRNDWALQLPAWLPHFHLVAIDLRGHGSSPKPAGPYRMCLLAEDVASLLYRLDAWPAHILGLSLGGAVAQQLALDQPQLVRSLVLVNTAPRFVSDSWRYRLMGLQRVASAYLMNMNAVAAQVAQKLFPLDEQAALRKETCARLAANDPNAYKACLWAVARFDIRASLSRIECPVLVIAGDRDTVLPMEPKRLLAERVANGQLKVIADSGHATPIDQPTAFNEAVLAFLTQIDTPALN